MIYGPDANRVMRGSRAEIDRWEASRVRLTERVEGYLSKKLEPLVKLAGLKMLAVPVGANNAEGPGYYIWKPIKAPDENVKYIVIPFACNLEKALLRLRQFVEKVHGRED
jgi:hypothetical protein